NPGYFLRRLPTSSTVAGSSGMTLANYESGRYLNKPTYDVTEDITAGYIMANTRISKLQVQGGVRYERTEIAANELDPYSNQQVKAAGFAVTAAGAPDSVAAMDYKYSRPRVARHGEYDDYFPSVTAKYAFLPNLLGDIGWGKTIKRPNLGNISGTRQIDSDNLLVTTPNPNLLPEHAEKIAASLSYFFGKAGVNNVQVVASRTKTQNQILGRDLTSDEYGNDDPTLDTYMFRSFTNASSPVIWKSMEYSYTQYLSFLPRVFQGTSINASYTRTYYTVSNPAVFVSGVIPNSFKATLGWSYNRVKLSFSTIWQDDSGPFLNSTTRYQKANTKCDLSGSIRFTDRLSFYFAGRNVFQQSHRIMEKSAGNPDVLFRYENYGTIWSFGIRGNF
ncbi:MAG: outer membrane beta-barrel protein, partial [Opitutus sp.]